MAVENEATPTAGEFTMETTTRASQRGSERFTDVMPADYDEKDNMDALKEQLARRKKPIYAGLAFLAVVVVGVSIAVSSGGGTEATTKSGYTAPTPAPKMDAAAAEAAGVHAADESASAPATVSSPGTVTAGAENESGVIDQQTITNTSTTTTPSPSSTPTPSSSAPSSTPTPTPTPSETSGPLLPWTAEDFDWKNPANWEYSSGAGVGNVVGPDGIKLTPANSKEPIRTLKGWGGEKIVLVEWERSESSDTNIWMLNTKLKNQFAKGNGWPYWGELDIFEMFTQDTLDKPSYDFSANGGGGVSSYGQLTLHNGPEFGKGDPCFCPAAPSKSSWYQSAPMTSGCTAQFANTPKNSIATVWGRDGEGQFLQLMQNPTITKGGKKGDAQTYDIKPGGTTTMKIYNNAKLFWGTPSSMACASGGGHNPATGFPFFEEFRLVLEEQKKNDPGAWFKVTNVQIFRKS